MNQPADIEQTKKLLAAALHQVLLTIDEFDLPYEQKMGIFRSASVVTLNNQPLPMERKQAVFAQEYKSSLYDLENLDRIRNPASKAAVYRD